MPITDHGLTGAVVRPGTEAHLTDEGWVVPMHITMPPELFEQYRQGYRCIRCHSVQSQPFPEVCETVWRDTGEGCGFRMKEDQMKWIEFEFKGETELWPDREEALDDEREREAWKKRTGIWLPGDE